jgi:cobalt transporter subunit CbtB
MTPIDHIQSTAVLPVPLVRRLALALVAGLLGIFLIWGVGFAEADRLHDAAHDSRHSLAFPCH